MKKNLPVLVDAVCEVFAMSLGDGRFAPKFSKEMGRLITHCNEAVNYICKKFGYLEFDKENTLDPLDAKLANQQHDIMETSDRWIIVEMPQAQQLANDGCLVVASTKNPNGPGHVVVLRPGISQFSSSWKSDAPKCVNVGGSVFIDKKLSFAFRNEPKYFVLVY